MDRVSVLHREVHQSADRDGQDARVASGQTMKIRVLGCSGGIGGGLRTTALLVDDDVLIDAGTGVGDLPLESLAKIDHIFVSHSHLDHVTSIPFSSTRCAGCAAPRSWSTQSRRRSTSCARTSSTGGSGPTSRRSPNADKPFMVYRELRWGAVEIKGRRFTPIPANHTVPAVGYVVSSARACLIYSGDTSVNDGLWQAVNAARNLKYLIIETGVPQQGARRRQASKHLCPQMLAEELEKMRANPEVYITHLKPGEGALTMREIGQAAGRWRPRMLENNQIFSL
jgi:ribonuclease BN (tRNA processing enzyme)